MCLAVHVVVCSLACVSLAVDYLSIAAAGAGGGGGGGSKPGVHCALGVEDDALTGAEEATPPLVGDYHIDIGIPLAASIKATEEAMKKKMIAGGEKALLGKFPHLGGLIIVFPDGSVSYCGSSLISTTRAVTAAHCCLNKNGRVRQITVVLGSTTMFSGGTRVTTSDFVTHPDYTFSGGKIRNDAAVILFAAIELNKNVQPIALAFGNDQFVDAWATAVGYGKYSDDESFTMKNQTLHYVKLKVIGNSVCQKTFKIDDSVLCVATSGGKSTCLGDSGGSLETDVRGVRTLIGITSFIGGGFCTKGSPAGYARVTFLRSWLLSI